MRGSRRPQTKSPIYVHPGAYLVSARTNFRYWVEATTVHIPSLGTDDGWSRELRQTLREHAALTVHRQAKQPVAPEPKHTQGF